jgi:hypothetical protein
VKIQDGRAAIASIDEMSRPRTFVNTSYFANTA